MSNVDDFKRPDIYDEVLIEKAMNYLKYDDPENSSREDAISLLAFMQTVAKEIAQDMSFEELGNMYKLHKNSKP